MFALVDCDNFYASCERLFKPDLNGKPIVVLSNNDGCVIARSNESKKLGIKMGEPYYQCKPTIVRNNVSVFSSNFLLYGDMSKRVMNTLLNYTPDIEIYSIDEAFLQFKGFEKHFDIREHCLDLKKTVRQWTGIPVSIGIAPTKALTKVATRVAKKFPTQTKGVHVIDSEEKRIKALKWTAIEDVWGVGYRYSKLLRSKNVNTAYDFTQLHPDWVKNKMTITGVRLHRDLCGLPTLKLDDPITTKKNILVSRTFKSDLETFDEVRERISTFAVKCAEKLRRQNSECGYVIVYIGTNRHKNPDKQYSRSTVIKLPMTSNISTHLNVAALKGLAQIFKKGYKYKRGGVTVGNIRPMGARQYSLFDKHQDLQSLMSAIDKMNTKYQKDYIKLATQDPGSNWKMKQENLSPNYTTRFSDIMIVK